MKNNIKFLYLLKDDIFILKDRIKFFDFNNTNYPSNG